MGFNNEGRAGGGRLTRFIIPGPVEDDLGSSIPPRGNVASHLAALDPGKAKVEYPQLTVLVHPDVTRLQVTMDEAGAVEVLAKIKGWIG